MLKEMFKKTTFIPLGRNEKEEEKPEVPKGLWVKCPVCGETLFKEDVVENKYICYKCGGYFRIKARNRIKMLADSKSFVELDKEMPVSNPLNYPGYEEKLMTLKGKIKQDEAVVTGTCKIHGEDVVIGVCDTRFFMGSMGHVVGEKITRAIEKATELKVPVILFTCSGGARMQEGIVSLMQMAKTSAALKRHSAAGLPYFTVLTDPTTGGVTASFAMLGDVILAEPGALIGFAGQRVIEQTIGQKLPEGFQRAEFLVEHGIIDGIVTRDELKNTLYQLIILHQAKEGYAHFKTEVIKTPEPTLENDDEVLPDVEMTAWDRVQTARMATRPTGIDYIEQVFENFMELHGDRLFRDDGAIVGGLAYLDGQPVTVIAQQKGRNTKDNITRNFGMPYPEGYRKALRLMKQAEKFNRPVITFIDTPGAFCGIEAEERGQGEAIARNLMEMADLTVPVLSIVIGEGGSGGALALGVGNEVWMMENATYSVLSPEGFASILWKDSKLASEAAEVMKITAEDLLQLQVIEHIIEEPKPASEENIAEISEAMKNGIKDFLDRYSQLSKEEIAAQRYERFRRI